MGTISEKPNSLSLYFSKKTQQQQKAKKEGRFLLVHTTMLNRSEAEKAPGLLFVAVLLVETCESPMQYQGTPLVW